MAEAVSAAIAAAKVIKRIMDLLETRKANFAYMDDVRSRMQSLQRVIDMIHQAYDSGPASADGAPPQHELSFATDGVLDMLEGIAAYVEDQAAARASTPKDATRMQKVKASLKKFQSVMSADDIKVRLRELDDKMSRYMLLLNAALGAAALRRQRAMEAAVERLAKMSENMFALQMLAMAPPAQSVQPRGYPVASTTTAVHMHASVVSSSARGHTHTHTHTSARYHTSVAAPGAEDARSSQEAASEDEQDRASTAGGRSSSASTSAPAGEPLERQAGEALEAREARAQGGVAPAAEEQEPPATVATAVGIERTIVHAHDGHSGGWWWQRAHTGPRRGRVVLEDPPEALAHAMLLVEAGPDRVLRGSMEIEAVTTHERVVAPLRAPSSYGTLPGKLGDTPEQVAVAIAAAGVAAAGGGRAPRAIVSGAVRYLTILAHQFITCAFTGALALISAEVSSRVSVALLVPVMPVLSTLALAWYAGTLSAALQAGLSVGPGDVLPGVLVRLKPLLRSCWTIYVMYASPCVCGVIFLALRGRLDREGGADAFNEYLQGCLIGSALFCASYWLAS